MSTLQTWIHQFFQSDLWKLYLSHFTVADWTVTVVLFFGVIYGIRKGFWKIVSDNLRILIVIVVTMEYGHLIAERLQSSVGLSPEILAFASFIVSAVVLWFVVSFIIRHLKKLFSSKTSFLLRFVGGSVLGAAYFLVLLSFLSQLVFLSPWERLKTEVRKQTPYTGRYLEKIAPQIHQSVMRPLQFLGTR